ncbi:kinase A anchor protein [Lipomyces arxii]|uniref:kinase A anchor protein n=1 Tax=Lipomyces arxii TaxID=56418 RepID=UPI0034CE5F7B
MAYKRNPSGRLTHFLAIPLSTDAIEQSLSLFRDEIIKHHPNVPVKAIRPPSTVHLTIAVMSLGEGRNSRLDEAKMRLIQLPSSIIPASTLEVGLKGIETFSDANPERAHVLFASLIGADVPRLQVFADKTLEYFYNCGFPVQLKNGATNKVVLHATIVNTIYAKTKNDQFDANQARAKTLGQRKNMTFRPNINASDLIAKYADFEFLSPTKLTRIGLYKMGEKSAEEGGGYECVAYLDLP